MKRILFYISLLFATLPALAQTLSIEHFTKDAIFNQIEMSPNGDYIALSVPKGDRTNLVVVKREGLKPVNSIRFNRNEHPGVFFWANNSRLVYSKVYKDVFEEAKGGYGELFAVDYNGKNFQQIFGYSDEKSKIRSKRGLKAHGRIVSRLLDDEDHILVQAYLWGRNVDDPYKVYKVNINNTKRTRISTSPFGRFDIVYNRQGIPVIGHGRDHKNEEQMYWYQDEKWVAVDKESDLFDYEPVSLSADASQLYLESHSGKKLTDVLAVYDMKSKKITQLYQNPDFDIYNYVRDPDSRKIVAVKTVTDGAEYHYLDQSSGFAQLHQKFINSFPGADVMLDTDSLDNQFALVHVASDTIVGDYYLFDTKKQSVSYLISKRPWLKQQHMLPQKQIKFETRDGYTVYGYLTMPRNTDKPVPLVVDVHGGPYGVWDTWYLDTTSQLYANRGFAVLKVNFRGSGGYGKEHEETAYQKRATMIQEDIIDGTRWALGLKEIDDSKVCIMGGSFGGYSSLMAPLIEPDLYKCAAPMYGAYDLVYQMNNADYIGSGSVTIGAKEVYGETEEHWKKSSPLTYIDKLKTPLLIVTGGQDTRVPPQSAWNLKEALEERDMPFEWLYKAKEGHGFYNKDNRKELHQRTLAFFDKHLN